MFAAYLDEHPAVTLLKHRPVCPYPACEDRAAWAGIDPKDREELLAFAARYAEIPYPMVTATQFLAFVRSGSRTEFEKPYFERRRKLCAAVLEYCLTESEKALDAVIDGLWCICEETTWVISAHNINPIPGAPKPEAFPLPDTHKEYIDLFSAQTGMILALTLHLVGTRLDRVTPLITKRAEEEIARRVLGPFMIHDEFWWMGFIRKDLCNWTPWIVSNLLQTAALQVPDIPALCALTDRACRMLDRWLDCVPQDGGCDEGAAYWNMAGGALIDCLELLERMTDGKMTFWNVPKVRNILSFPSRVRLENGWFVNFADCDARPFISGERLQLAGEKMNDPVLTAVGSELRGTAVDQIADTPQLSRLLCRLFHAPSGNDGSENTDRDVWLPDLQVRVLEKNGLILCAKGGHNGESHNHNDVGSFMVYADGEPHIIDLGNMTYTARTFADARYTLMNTRSENHNVPLIGKAEQKPGAAFAAADVSCLEDGLTLDIAGAYGDAAVLRVQRRFELKDRLILRDRIGSADPKPVSWVFMLRYAPVCCGMSLSFGKLRMTWDRALQVRITEIPVTDALMAKNYPGSVWRVRLDAEPDTEQTATFVVERNELHE